MKTYVEEIVGKTIAGVVVRESETDPKRQVFLVFADDTHFELYGEFFQFGKHVYPGGMEHVVGFSREGAREISIYPQPGDVQD